jgi:hypothetical protein
VKVGTPLGEYPFEFRRVERHSGGVAIVGLVAGMESSVVLGRDELLRGAAVLALPVAGLALTLGWRWRCRAGSLRD